jgi:hypothetical protein
MLERTLLVLAPLSLKRLFVLAYSEIYVFRGNPFQAHSLQQSYHPTQTFKQEKIIVQNQKYKCKNNIKFIYLTFLRYTCKFEKNKQSFLSENYEQIFPNIKRKQSNAHAQARATSADSIPPRSL